jgi:hypothetical protein
MRRRIEDQETCLERLEMLLEEERESRRAAQTQAQMQAPPPPVSCVESAEEEDPTDAKKNFWRLHVRLQSDLHNQVHEYYRKKNQAYVIPAMGKFAARPALRAPQSVV